jgi:hypothetical protein
MHASTRSLVLNDPTTIQERTRIASLKRYPHGSKRPKRTSPTLAPFSLLPPFHLSPFYPASAASAAPAQFPARRRPHPPRSGQAMEDLHAASTSSTTMRIQGEGFDIHRVPHLGRPTPLHCCSALLCSSSPPLPAPPLTPCALIRRRSRPWTRRTAKPPSVRFPYRPRRRRPTAITPPRRSSFPSSHVS